MMAAAIGAPTLWRLSSGEKSHAPTPQHRKKMLGSGKSWHSPDFQAGAILVLIFAIWRWYLPWAGNHLGQIEIMALSQTAGPGFTEQVSGVFLAAMHQVGVLLAPILLPVLGTGLALGFLQSGFRFRPQAVLPDFSRVNVASGLARMVSRQSMWEMVRGLLKLAVIGASAGSLVVSQFSSYPRLMTLSVGDMLRQAGQDFDGVLMRAAIAFLFIGLVDVVYQRRQFEQSLKMSTQEVRDEMKETEGDPRVRGRRREMMRRLARGGLKAVKQATVVVTNPTHYAVALKWDEAKMAAPQIVAKGSDEMALRIREIAYAAEVPVVENPPVARALYEVPVGQPVPVEHYQVVAEIIAFILRRRARRVQRGIQS